MSRSLWVSHDFVGTRKGKQVLASRSKIVGILDILPRVLRRSLSMGRFARAFLSQLRHALSEDDVRNQNHQCAENKAPLFSAQRRMPTGTSLCCVSARIPIFESATAIDPQSGPRGVSDIEEGYPGLAYQQMVCLVSSGPVPPDCRSGVLARW